MNLHKKRLLITGARFYVALDLARQFHAYGHEIYTAESSDRNVCRFSNAVKQDFVVASPRFDTETFIDQLAAIVEEHKIDMLIPTFEETFYISQNLDRFPKSCKVFTIPFDRLEPLHNKWKFIETLESLGFKTPRTILINNQQDLDAIDFEIPYVLKASYCRAGLDIHIVKPPEERPVIQIEEHNPWIAQEWIDGDQYCSYSVCHNGKVTALSVYPVEFTVGGKGCITFRTVQHEKINAWIERFVRGTNHTGQIAFDFIESRNGELYAIECNPRATSGVHLFDPEDKLIDAFLNENNPVIFPHSETKKQLAMGMVLYGWKNRSIGSFIQTFTTTPDVIFSKRDVKPFFSIPYVYGMYLGMSLKMKKTIPAAFTHDIEWNNE